MRRIATDRHGNAVLSLGLSLLGIGKNVLGWLTAGVKYLMAAWYRIVIALLLAACLWLYVGKSSETKRADKFKRMAESEMSLRIANEVAYKDAQKVAAEIHKRKIADYEERERNHAITTDKTIRNNVNLALAGLRARQATERLAGRSRNAQAPTSASDTNGSGGVSIVDAGNAGNEDDVRICTENTVKLIGAREYLLTLPE
jgi:hypothetical protein